MLSLVLDYLSYWKPLGYLLIFVGMILEGDAVLFTAAFLTHQGFFRFGIISPTVLSGALIGDVFWYWIGERLNSPKSPITWYAGRIAKPFDSHLAERPVRTIFISKFTYGLHHAILTRAGALKLKLTPLMESDSIATVFWILAVGGLGYVSSISFSLASKSLRFIEIALVLGLAVLLILEYIITQASKKKI